MSRKEVPRAGLLILPPACELGGQTAEGRPAPLWASGGRRMHPGLARRRVVHSSQSTVQRGESRVQSREGRMASRPKIENMNYPFFLRMSGRGRRVHLPMASIAPAAGAAQSHSCDVSVIVMAYNEVANIESTVLEIHGTLKRLHVAFEIVLIDDGSTDGTGQVAVELASRLANIRVLHHPTNQGLGGVYRTGFAEGRGQFATFFPADGQFPAAIIEQWLPLMVDHDLVLGYLPGLKRSLIGLALSKLERILYRLLFGPMPRFQGVLMFRRELLREVELKSEGRGWAVLMEFILRVSRAGKRVISVPTEVRSRRSGRSKVNNLRTIFANLQQVLVLYRRL
jgi:hypothetical protein